MLNLDAENTVDTSFSEIGLTLTPEGRIEVSGDFADAVAGQLKMVHETLAGENGFFTKISEALSRIQDQRTSQYVMAYNSVLSYSSEGTGRKSIYQESSGSIISFFA